MSGQRLCSKCNSVMVRHTPWEGGEYYTCPTCQWQREIEDEENSDTLFPEEMEQ